MPAILGGVIPQRSDEAKSLWSLFLICVCNNMIIIVLDIVGEVYVWCLLMVVFKIEQH